MDGHWAIRGLIVASAVALAGCQQDVRLDTSSIERFTGSIAEANRLRPQDSTQLEAAAARFASVYFGDERILSAPPQAATLRLRASELPAFVARHLVTPDDIEVRPTFPNPWLVQQI